MRRLLKAATLLLALAGAALTVPLVLGFLGRLHPLFDSLSHFRLHLAATVAAAGLLLLVAAPGWRRNGAAMAALALAATAATLWPMPRDTGQAELPRPAYKLIQMNLRFDNPRPELVFDLLAREKPDVVTLEEVSRAWAARLPATEAAYPHRVVCPTLSYTGGVAILSRLPFAAPPRCTRGGALAVATVDFDGRPAEVAALHLVWPWPFGQDRQVPRLAPFLLTELGPRAVLAGDFNATPWSGSVRALAAAGGLRLAQWVGPSYLDRRLPDWLRPLAGLPIDHVLTKGDIVAGRPTRLAAAGSDHLPVMFEFAIAEPPPVVRTAAVGSRQ